MFRLSRRPSRTRLAVLGTGVLSAALLSMAGLAATAGPAAADSVINVHYALTGTTFLNKLNTTVNLGSGTLSSSADLTTACSTPRCSTSPSPARATPSA